MFNKHPIDPIDPKVVNVKIDNVARYFAEQYRDGKHMIDHIAPIVVSPFPEAVFYFYVDGATPLAALVQQYKVDSDERGEVIDQYRTHAGGSADDNFDDLRFFQVMRLYYPRPGLELGTMAVYVDSLGNRCNHKAVIFVPKDGLGLHQDRAVLADLVLYNATIVHLAMSFAHCKNVKLIDEPLTRQQRRMLERKGGTRYKILDIEPFKQQVRRETRPGESQIQRALHICRGHFATYTDDAPLFGKVTGTFWKPMHVRGSKSVGEVIKDYQIVT